MKPLLCTTAVPEEEEVGIEEMGIENEIIDQEKEGSNQKSIMNTKNAEGNVTRCRMCESKYHWVEN